MLIGLLRHGETLLPGRYCGRTDVLLSEQGHRAMSAVLAGSSWQRVISSPLSRCAHFAQAYAADHGIACALDARWCELDFGEWENSSAAELQARDAQRLGDFWRDPLANPPPGGEHLQSLQARVSAAWEEALTQAREENLLIVTHGGPLRVLLAQQRGLPLGQCLQMDVPLASLRLIEC